MRTITINELPEDLHRKIVIKSSEQSRYKRLSVALERTLNHCSEIHAEYESQAIRLRESCERQGFEAGFQLFFSQLVTLIDKYQQCQNQYLSQFRQHISDALRQSLHDPMIVERIIHHLQEHCGHQKALRIIIPTGVNLPDGADTNNYQYTKDNHITVQNDMDAVRFPSELLCQEWLQHAHEATAPVNTIINNLTPNTLHDIAGQLIAMSNQTQTSPLKSEQEDNHEQYQQHDLSASANGTGQQPSGVEL